MKNNTLFIVKKGFVQVKHYAYVALLVMLLPGKWNANLMLIEFKLRKNANTLNIKCIYIKLKNVEYSTMIELTRLTSPDCRNV